PSDAVAVLSLDDAVQPAQTRGDVIESGRISTGVATTVFTISQSQNRWTLYAGSPQDLDTSVASAIDAAMPAFRYAGAPHRWTPIGRIPPASVGILTARSLSLASACMIGQAIALADVTVQYMKDRMQFGVPIG